MTPRRGVMLGVGALLLVAAGPAAREPATVRVRLVTSAGSITLALDARRAPLTVANFLRYVDDGRLEGTHFYRAARRKGDLSKGFIQGGIGTDARRILPSVPLEPTSKTGIRHLSGTISMARSIDPNSAHGNFSIMVGDNPTLDARPGKLGYAAFGRVIGGMDVVGRILAMPTGGGREEMRGQMILKRVRILRAERLDGTAKPTGRPRPWLIDLPWRRD
jgi:peptidyl-prolyl cis-trans isomerase A (cyclophilin A)